MTTSKKKVYVVVHGDIFENVIFSTLEGAKEWAEEANQTHRDFTGCRHDIFSIRGIIIDDNDEDSFEEVQ